MKTNKFHLKLEGPTGSGKSRFMEFVIKACSQDKEWSAEKTFIRPGSHILTVTRERLPLPN